MIVMLPPRALALPLPPVYRDGYKICSRCCERRDRAPAVLSQAGAPLCWTSERADTFFVCERARKSAAHKRQPQRAERAHARRREQRRSFRLRATTKQADRKRAMREQQAQTKLSG